MSSPGEAEENSSNLSNASEIQDQLHFADQETDNGLLHVLMGSETDLSKACASVSQSVDTLNCSEQSSIVTLNTCNTSLTKSGGKSNLTLDRLSYICSHQGPNIVSSPNMRPKSFGSMSTDSSVSVHVPLAKWDSCSTAMEVVPCMSPLLCETCDVTTGELPPEGESSRVGSPSTFPGSPETYSKLNESCGLMCRICHCGEEDDEVLMTPCRCTGTVKYAHQSCVLNWISKSGNQYCELCKYKYKTKRKKIKSLWKWRFPSVSTKGWLHIGLFIAFVTMLLTSITWIVWSRVSSTPTAVAERTTDEVKFAYMLNGLFIALAVGGLYFDSYRHIRRYFQRWSVLNRHMIIEPYCRQQNNKTKEGDEGIEVTRGTWIEIEERRVLFNSLAVEMREAEECSTENAGKNKNGKEKGTWV